VLESESGPFAHSDGPGRKRPRAAANSKSESRTAMQFVSDCAGGEGLCFCNAARPFLHRDPKAGSDTIPCRIVRRLLPAGEIEMLRKQASCSSRYRSSSPSSTLKPLGAGSDLISMTLTLLQAALLRLRVLLTQFLRLGRADLTPIYAGCLTVTRTIGVLLYER